MFSAVVAARPQAPPASASSERARFSLERSTGRLERRNFLLRQTRRHSSAGSIKLANLKPLGGCDILSGYRAIGIYVAVAAAASIHTLVAPLVCIVRAS